MKALYICYFGISSSRRRNYLERWPTFCVPAVWWVLCSPVVLIWLDPAPVFWVPSVTLVCLLLYALMVWRVVLTRSERGWLAAIPKRLLMPEM